MPIAREEIAAVFRTFLGRPPGPEVYENNAARDSIDDFIRHVVQSPEFMNRLVARFHSTMPTGLLPRKQDRIVYLHIPKCGGTTLHHLLMSWWGQQAMHRERFNGLYYYSAADLATKAVFSGHYDFYSTQLVPGRPRLISFLRDPRDRLVSLYNFHRAHSAEYAARTGFQMIAWAHDFDIDAYFANESVRRHSSIDNSIARYFSDVPQIVRRWEGENAHREASIESMAEEALGNVFRFDFIGFMDRYEESIRQLATLLGRDQPARIEKRQVLDDLMEKNLNMRRIEKQLPSTQTLTEMEDLIRFDQRVVDAARARFAQPGAAPAPEDSR